MRKTLIALLLCLCTAAATAQVRGLGFGPRVGVNFADYLNSPGSSRTALYAGLFLDYHFTHRWGIETGAYYSQLGSARNIEQGYALQTTHRMDYLSVPLVAKFNFLGGFRVIAGAEGLFKLSADRKAADGGTIYPLSDVRPANIALTIGAGYLFRCGLDITASYSKGLRSAFLHQPQTTCPTYFRVAVGWRFIATNR